MSALAACNAAPSKVLRRPAASALVDVVCPDQLQHYNGTLQNKTGLR